MTNETSKPQPGDGIARRRVVALVIGAAAIAGAAGYALRGDEATIPTSTSESVKLWTALVTAVAALVVAIWRPFFDRDTERVKGEFLAQLEHYKNTLSHESAEKLAEHRAALDRDTARELDTMRSNLQRDLREHEIRFARLHERRLEALIALHKAIGDAEQAWSSASSVAVQAGDRFGAAEKQPYTAVLETTVALGERIGAASIFVDEEFCAAMAAVWGEVTALLNKFQRVIADTAPDPAANLKRTEVRVQIYYAVREKLPPLRTDVERRIRATFGVASPAGTEVPGNAPAPVKPAPGPST